MRGGLTVSYAARRVGVCDLSAEVGIAARNRVAMLLLAAYGVITLALAVNVTGYGAGTARGVIVLLVGTVTGAVTVSMKLEAAYRTCLGGGGRVVGVTRVRDAVRGNAVIGARGSEIEPLLVDVKEVVDGVLGSRPYSYAVNVAVKGTCDLAFYSGVRADLC